MNKRPRLFKPRQLLAGLGTLALAMATAHASDFPSRPITLVSPYGAGGAADIAARAIAVAAGKELGQTVIVESKPGAEGLVGAADVMHAPPDGYRVFWGGAGSMMIVPALRKEPPFDPAKAFTPISGIAEFSFFLFVNKNFPANDMAEFIKVVKDHPGKYNYGTGNNQGLLTMKYLSKLYDLQIQQVSYRGEVAVINDMIPDRMQALFGTGVAAPHVKSGDIKALVTTLSERSPLLPNVPTMKETGIKQVPFSPGGGWLGFFGPAGMDPKVVARLDRAFTTALSDPKVQEIMQSVGVAYTPMTREQLAKFVVSQRDHYVQAVTELGVTRE